MFLFGAFSFARARINQSFNKLSQTVASSRPIGMGERAPISVNSLKVPALPENGDSMTYARKFRLSMLVGTAALVLSACGADDVSSPGEGVIVIPPGSTGGTTSGGTTSGGTTTGGTTTAPADCPSGFSNAGLIAGMRNCQLSGTISSDLNIPKRAGTIYSLSGRVNVGVDVGAEGNASGGKAVNLSVDPGVVVFGSSGLDFLVVHRGSKLNAVGTQQQPIIFTARRNVEGQATDDSQGLWGGIVLLGRAPISDCLGDVTGGSAQCQQQFEGSADAPYGGALAADSSGALQYVQIRYSGYELAPNREINGLTLAGTGSGTLVDHVQVHNGSDDAVEWFGGRTNAKYLVLTGNDDDNLDTDFGFKGAIQFVIAAQRASGNSGDSIIESDSNGNEDATPRQNTMLSNATFIHRSTGSSAVNAILLRGGTDYRIANSVITSPRHCLDVDGATTMQAAGAAGDEQGPPVFASVAFACTQGAVNDDGNVAAADIQALIAADANNKASHTSSLTGTFINGANETAIAAFSALSSWSSFFTQVGYVGAVQNASDTWYRGWTCDSSTADFGSGNSCTAIPAQ